MSDAKTLFLQYALVPLIGGLALLAGWALLKLSSWLEAHGAQSKLFGIAAKVAHFADHVVRELDVTLRPKLAISLADGELSASEAAELKAAAVSRLKALLTEAGLAELSALGISLPSQVDTYLGGAIEKAVAGMKEGAASPSA